MSYNKCIIYYKQVISLQYHFLIIISVNIVSEYIYLLYNIFVNKTYLKKYRLY